MPDMLLTCCITAALALLWPMTRGRAGPYWIGFYGSTAAGFWAKGPAGLLPLAVALMWGLVDRAPARWRTLRLGAGLLLLGALIGPWWLREALSPGVGAQQAIVTDQLSWYVIQAPSVKALLGPVRNLFGILFPWVLLLPLAIVQAVRKVRRRDADRDPLFFLLLWSVVILVAVGLSQQQRLRYYLPLVPSASLIIGWWFARAPEPGRQAGKAPWPLCGFIVAAMIGGALGLTMLRGRLPVDVQMSLPASPLEALLVGGALGIMLAALAYGVALNKPAETFVAAWVAAAVFVATAYHGEMSRRNEASDYAGLRASMARRLAPAPPVVAVWGLQELPMSFYFERSVTEVENESELLRVLAREPRGVAIVTDTALAHSTVAGDVTTMLQERFALRQVSVVTYRSSQ